MSMEIRRDPITQSWVVSGQRGEIDDKDAPCPFDPGVVENAKTLLTWPSEGPWQVRAIPHPDALYRVENEPGRAAEGIYDKMGPLGAHEVVIETPEHDKKLWQLGDEQIDRVLWAWGSRLADLKKDPRFKYVSVFKNQGALAGEEWTHAHSEVTATIFVPRRIKYELGAAHEWFKDRQHYVFSVTLFGRKKNRASASLMFKVITTHSVLMLRGCHLNVSCTAATTISLNSRGPVPIAVSSQPCWAGFCGALRRSHLRFTWLCIPRPTPAIKKASYPVTGKHSQMITIGTSRSCRFLKGAASRTASRKSISMLYCPSWLPSNSAQLIPIHEHALEK